MQNIFVTETAVDAPFIYNRPVNGRSFIGRKTEVPVLANLLRDGENIVMYEPPKAGKDSILQQVFYDMKLSGMQFNIASLSLLNVRSVNDFCLLFGSAVLKLFGASKQDYSVLVAELLGKTHFVFDDRVYENSGSLLALGWDIDDDDIRTLLALPYRLARRSGRKLYVCIDDFQNVMLTEDGDRICSLMQEVFIELVQDAKRRGKTVLMSSHMFTEIEKTCDRTAIIRNGRIIAIVDMNDISKSAHKEYKIKFFTRTDSERFSKESFTFSEVNPAKSRVKVKIDDSEINTLIAALSGYGVRYISEEKQTLEDYFMHFYQRDAKTGKEAGV